MDLDNTRSYKSVDTLGMLDHIRALPQQCADAWALAQTVSLPDAYRRVRHVVIVGIGGSAMGATAVQGLVAAECRAPISVVRDYVLPGFAQGSDYLVIGCSYSGNTEETLSAMREAFGRGALPLAITTGGHLAALAREQKAPLVRYGYQSQPRAALGYPLILLLGVCWRLGLVDDHSAYVAEAVREMRAWGKDVDADVPTARNEAKRLALRISNKLPVVYGAGHLYAVANRWKTQFNENTKYWSYFEPMPELQHNSVVGFDSVQPVGQETIVLMLRSSRDHARVKIRYVVTAEMLAQSNVAVDEIHARGDRPLAQMMSLIHFGDYVSYYLALLNDTDPTPVDAIAYLKRRLSEEGE
jgi:glucose/mannose-6-phosphate isomerase